MQKRAKQAKKLVQFTNKFLLVVPLLSLLCLVLPIYFLATLPFAFPILTAGGASYVHLAFWLLLTAGGVTLLLTGKLMQF